METLNGAPFSGAVFSDLPTDPALRKERVKNAVTQTGAYALLVAEQLEGEVRAIFESQHGSRTWRLPLKDHGDVRVLGTPVVRDNAESIGVLWTAS